jgi:hypothetical protein
MVMQEEIFGPILPVIPYDDLDDGLAIINAGERPSFSQTRTFFTILSPLRGNRRPHQRRCQRNMRAQCCHRRLGVARQHSPENRRVLIGNGAWLGGPHGGQGPVALRQIVELRADAQ